MQKIQERTDNDNGLQWLVLLCCQLIFVGFVCSRALTSIGMAGLVAAAIIFKGPVEVFRKYFQTKELLILSLFFWIVFISGAYSEDKANWLNWVRIKLPFLVLPLAFAVVPHLDSRKLGFLLYGFLLTFFASTTIVLINYFMHFESFTNSFNRGGEIPMPYSHIRYTLMLAFSFFCAVYLFENKFRLFSKNEKWLQAGFAVFAFIALHILAIRSGLLALYLGLFYLAVLEIIKKKKILLGGIALILLCVIPVLALRYIPSLQNKIGYMRYDLEQYQRGDINEYSDAMRILSMKIGLRIWQQNPVLGVGAGDLQKETYKIYSSDYPQISERNRRLPHNQFIWVLVSTGIVGLVLFLTAFFYPFVTGARYKYWPVMLLHILLFSSFFTEDTFEEQMGTGFYLIFLLILMNHFKRE